MKKLVLTLGFFLSYVGMAYSMNDIRDAITRHDWRKVVSILKEYPEDRFLVNNASMSNLGLLCTADTATLNAVGPSGSYLLLTLICHNGDACEQALVTLIKQKKLSLEAQDTNGRLLCKQLTDNNKKKLLNIIDRNDIDNPFTYTVRDNPSPITARRLTSNITLALKEPNDYAWISADNKIRLSITMMIIAGTILAAHLLYKWRATKATTEDKQDDEYEEEAAEPATV